MTEEELLQKLKAYHKALKYSNMSLQILINLVASMVENDYVQVLHKVISEGITTSNNMLEKDSELFDE